MITKPFLAVFAICVLCLFLAPVSGSSEESPASGLLVRSDTMGFTLSLDGAEPFHRTGNEVIDDRLIDVAGSTARLALWSEVQPGGGTQPFYAISLDGSNVGVVRQTSYVIELRHGRFDPETGVPPVEASLRAAEAADLYLVQFGTQPLEEFRTAITDLGGTVHKFIANHTHFVRMTPAVKEAVASLPYVRWVGPVHPAYKLEEEIREQITGAVEVDPRRYSIMLHERGVEAQDRVVKRIQALDGEIHGTTPQGFRIEATLSLDQVREIATLGDVMFIDRKGALEHDMDIVREIGGANHVETVAGFTGQGVRAEVADSELDEDHPEWSAPPIIHVSGASVNHGTSVYGILFARGADPQARGLIPDGTGIFAFSTGLLGGGPTRYTHTAELVDPAGPYRAVLQTNSTGDPRTFFYTTISAEMDDILFINDIAITQSQSNAGNQDSRPQAWAKNVISGGAVDHFNTLTRDDDSWSSGSGSIGPADDGRIKPDLCFFYDLTYAPSAGGGYTEFGGTSGATPSIAGHLGLFFQMWSEQVFGNDVPNPGGTVFENRPHMTTAKAALINTATQYPFDGEAHDMTRVHQGWGMPSVQYLYDMRDKISFIDETEVLGNLESVEFVAFVEGGQPELRVTMAYADPMGTPGAAMHRINDLTLKVTSPSSVVYWGNNGLLSNNFSTPGGSANVIDTVENVFVQNPEAGVWSVEIIASEVNEDSHVETPELDADFALVVSGADLTNCTSAGRAQIGRNLYACSGDAAIRVVDCDLDLSETVMDTVTVTVASTSEPGGETLVLTETAPTTADFRNTIPMSVVDAPGVLQVADGDIVTLTYVDADDGEGGTSIVVEDTATLDCAPPAIFNVQASDVTGAAATVSWETSETADGVVHYGTSSIEAQGTGTSHSVRLEGLDECTTYLFSVTSVDTAGNAATDDNQGALHAFSTGENNQPEFDSTDVPKTISDNTTFTSVVQIDDDETVLDVDVLLNLTHTYDGDLDIYLVGPNGTRVELTSDNGGTGENFVDTIFDDEAETSITSGSAPFTGSFQPEGSLADLDGISSAGTWTLEVTDDAGADQGQLTGWAVILTFEAQPCGAALTLLSQQLEADACSTGSAGADNGRWEVGELVEFSLTVKNDGSSEVTNTVAYVTPVTPGIVMLDGAAGVDDLGPGVVGTTRPPHIIAQLTDSLTCGQVVEFQIDVVSNEGSWPASFTQMVGEIVPQSHVELEEGFSTGIPATWTVVDGYNDGFTWFADNPSDPAGCANPDPAAPIVGAWAAVDSGCAGPDVKMREELISPVLDFSADPDVSLEFDHWFEWSPGSFDEVADVDVRSSLTGGQWVNVAQWTGASTPNSEHVVLDISAQAAGAADVQIRWHYREALNEATWYIDNVLAWHFIPDLCLNEVCSAPASSPPPVPDGSGVSQPVLMDRLAADGSQLAVTWDDQCSPVDTKIVYGTLDQVSTHTISGSICSVSSPLTWDAAPAGDVWFVVVTDDGLGVESSWGESSEGERNGLADSATCGSTAKDITGSCP